MSEEFALNQRGRQGCTVDFDEWHARALAPIVNRPSDEFFACSCFTENEYACVSTGHALDIAQETQHILAATNDLIEVMNRFQFILQIFRLPVSWRIWRTASSRSLTLRKMKV